MRDGLMICRGCGSEYSDEELDEIGVADDETRRECLCANCVVDKDSWLLKLPEAKKPQFIYRKVKCE